MPDSFGVDADRDLCIGSGLCATVTPIFELDETGKVRLLAEEELPVSELEAVEDAVALCPVQALAVRRTARA